MDDIGLMSERIDAHHHVWDLAVRDQPWMAGDGMDPLRRSFGIDEYIAQARKNGIAASVVVQTVADISETEELLDLAAATSQVTGVVGWVDLAQPTSGRNSTDCWRDRPGRGWSASAAWCNTSPTRRGWRALLWWTAFARLPRVGWSTSC